MLMFHKKVWLVSQVEMSKILGLVHVNRDFLILTYTYL